MKKVMRNKKVIAMMVVGLVAIFLAASGVVASPPMFGDDPPVESKINYQGQLMDDAGNPLDGTYDMEFRFYNAAVGGSQVGSTISRGDVAVANGLFSVKLDVDQSDFNGQGLWLEVKVEGETLSPRQEILPVPYALSLKPGAEISDVHITGSLQVDGPATGFFPRPAYDSGWVSMARGETKMLTHNLGGNVDNYVVDLWYKDTAEGGQGINHLRYGGGTKDILSNWSGSWWRRLTNTTIEVKRLADDTWADQIRVRIWVYE